MKKVLVVDDAKNIRMLLTKCLELEGYQVKTATNGKDALVLFSSERFDLAFLDIKLPELSGTEVLRRIRAQGNDTPVIVITAYPTVKNAVECTKLQSITYLQKPFTADRLRAVLKEVTPPTRCRRPPMRTNAPPICWMQNAGRRRSPGSRRLSPPIPPILRFTLVWNGPISVLATGRPPKNSITPGARLPDPRTALPLRKQDRCLSTN